MFFFGFLLLAFLFHCFFWFFKVSLCYQFFANFWMFWFAFVFCFLFFVCFFVFQFFVVFVSFWTITFMVFPVVFCVSFLGEKYFSICSCWFLVFCFLLRFLGFFFQLFASLSVVWLCFISYLFFFDGFSLFAFLVIRWFSPEFLGFFVLFGHSDQIGSLGLFSNVGDKFTDLS